MTDPVLCVCVTTPTGDEMQPEADSFEVSERRVLTLKNGEDVVAIYAPGSWTSVTRKPTPA